MGTNPLVKLVFADGAEVKVETILTMPENHFRFWLVETLLRAKICKGYHLDGSLTALSIEPQKQEPEPDGSSDEDADELDEFLDEAIKTGANLIKSKVKFYIDRGFSPERSMKETARDFDLPIEGVREVIDGEKTENGGNEPAEQ